MTESSRPFGVPHLPRWLVLTVTLLVAGAFALPTVAAAPAPVSSHAFATYDTGRVRIVLPSAAPSVELFQDANSSVNAVLTATSVVELDPNGSGYDVVASATPTLATSFNGSRPSASTGPWALSLAADLAVRPTSETQWNGSVSSPVTPAASYGFAELRVDFAPTPSGGSGTSLAVSWSVSNWPLSEPDDLVGVVFSFAASNAPTTRSCESTSILSTGTCFGSPLDSGNALWNGGFVGVEADGTAGAVASVGWSPSATNGSAAPVLTGVRLDPSGGADVVLAAPSGPTAAVGSLAFGLSAPSVPVLPPTIAGIGPIYLIGASVAAAGALGGFVVYRERDERIRREL
ncbi:MAG: hypothetical protein L3J77_02980 [Thermoplasmata archaeon]|nr:hypothetical protein [Thermoplasmata archaeon]